jgi:hypothetical protein
LREKSRQLAHAFAHRIGSGQGVAGWRELHANTGGWLAVQSGRSRKRLRGQLNPGDVPQTNGGTVRIGTQHDVAKLFGVAELTVDNHRGGNRLPSDVRQLADRAG